MIEDAEYEKIAEKFFKLAQKFFIDNKLTEADVVGILSTLLTANLSSGSLDAKSIHLYCLHLEENVKKYRDIKFERKIEREKK